MTEPFVSIVTPVYNDEPYLEECIQSILGQTHQNFEYVICNNHSKDRSGEIAKDYAAKDRRIRVLTPPEFLPQAKNFNFALQRISPHSSQCKMLLSDDWLYPDCVRQMTTLAESDPDITLVSAYRLIETTPDCFGLPPKRNVFTGEEACRAHLFGTAYPFGSQTTVLYRSDVVRSRAPAFFPEDRFYFDVDVAFRILHGKKFGFVHQILSFSRYQPGTITDEASNFNTWFLSLLVTLEQYGRTYLTPEEYDRRYREVAHDFYLGLGEVWLKDRVRRNKRHAFWAFQKKHLGAIGLDIRPELLAKGIGAAALKFIGHPGDTVDKVKRKVLAAPRAS